MGPTPPFATLALCWLLALCCPSVGAFDVSPDTPYPTDLTLKAAVITNTKPLAYYQPENRRKAITSDIISHEPSEVPQEYKGFQPDLLRHLVSIAKRLDNVNLSFELEEAPAFSHFYYFRQLANDCEGNCDGYDLVVGDFYGTPDRSIRTVLSPPLLNTAAATVKWDDPSSAFQAKTLEEAQARNNPVCLQKFSNLRKHALEKFPDLQIVHCPDFESCVTSLKANLCALILGDELQLKHLTVDHPKLEVRQENFHKQLIVWPFNARLNPLYQQLMLRWIYEAQQTGILDELYQQYFQSATCKVGFAGENCDEPCDPDHGKSDKYGVCICTSTRYTGADCSKEVSEDKNLIADSASVTIAYAMIGINFTVVAICAIWLACFRNATPVKVAQPLFLALVLVGCVVSTSTIFAMAQEDAGAEIADDNPYGHGEADLPACMAIPWLYSVGFSITFGSLFAKIRRVHLLFNAAATMQRVTVSPQETFLIVGGVLLIDVSILTIWTLVDPLEWFRQPLVTDQFGYPLSSEGYCRSDHFAVFASLISLFHFSIMGVACWMCYLSRDIPTRFSEGKYLTVAMISNMQIFVVAVPVLVILGGDPQAGFFVRSAVIWMNDLAVLALIFGNLIKNVHFEKDALTESRGEMVRSALNSFVRKRAERAGDSSSLRTGDCGSLRTSDQTFQTSRTVTLSTSKSSAHFTASGAYEACEEGAYTMDRSGCLSPVTELSMPLAHAPIEPTITAGTVSFCEDDLAAPETLEEAYLNLAADQDRQVPIHDEEQQHSLNWSGTGSRSRAAHSSNEDIQGMVHLEFQDEQDSDNPYQPRFMIAPNGLEQSLMIHREMSAEQSAASSELSELEFHDEPKE